MNKENLAILSRRATRHLKRISGYLSRYQMFIFLTLTACFGAILIAQNSDVKDSSQIFKKEGQIDFKNASILGNPTRALLHEEESNLSKTQRSVLEAQNSLKKEVETLRVELQQLKKTGPKSGSDTVPTVSDTALDPSLESQNTSRQEIPLDEGAYGPQPAPTLGFALSPSSAEPGAEFNHNRIQSDQIKTHAAAPISRQGNSLGFSDIGISTKSQREKTSGSSLISFPVKSTGKVFLKKPGIILPSGSYVKAMLLTGVEAPEGKTYPVLMQLDFAYVVPNDKRLDLAGCFMIAKAQGDLSTERVQMQATKLSCVSKKHGMFEREVNGFVADNVDNSFAVLGRVNTKQDRVAATAFLASIVAGIGRAVQQAQTTQQATPLGGGQSIVTGDQMKYIGAGGVSESASMITQWYLKQAQNLLPTINVGSGQEVWIVMQDQVDLPKDYFIQNNSGGISNVSIYSYFTRLLD